VTTGRNGDVGRGAFFRFLPATSTHRYALTTNPFPADAPFSMSPKALFLVLRFRDDFENDGLYIAYVNLTFAGHSCPTLTAVSFVRPRKRWVVLTHPTKSVAVRAKSVDHAACLNSRKASIARLESMSLRCSPRRTNVLIAPSSTSAVCCGSSISPEASRKSQAIWSEFSMIAGRGSFIKTEPFFGPHVPTLLIAFCTSAARDK
jgi:hypothetical protein